MVTSVCAPLYRPEHERDGCGVGFVAHVEGRKSHAIVQMALQAVVNLTHRGAVSADGKSGDGAGILTQIPLPLFNRLLRPLGVQAEQDGDLGVGMLFLPPQNSQAARNLVEACLKGVGLQVALWRPVPTDPSALGEKALATKPDIWQALVLRPRGMDFTAFARALYLARKEAERLAQQQGLKGFYIPSFSNRTVVYKGLMVAPQLSKFYLDLQDPDFQSALAVFHQRYSTNTFPTWFLAQPFRFLAHNGEINTLMGNRNWVRAKEPELSCKVWGEEVRRLVPIIQEGGSDSAQLDNVLEALVLSGRGVLHSMAMLVPEAWENMPHLDPAWRAFYEYHACLMEPWDGPAALAFTDGVVVGAALDRNGLRPARYQVTYDGLVVMASEVGVLDIPEESIVEKGRLGPGQMLAVDTATQRLLKNQEIKDALSQAQPYGEWVRRHLVSLPQTVKDLGLSPVTPSRPDLRLERAFGYTSEEVNLVLEPMAANAQEPTGSMGDDTPLAVLATKPRLLYSYFKQKFAQVTNPPIDPLREQIVMALHTYLGPRRSFLEEDPEAAHLLFHPSPILLDHELEAIRRHPDPAFRAVTIPCLFPVQAGVDGLEPALREVCRRAVEAVDSGAGILILSDKGVNEAYAPIPMLMAVGAVHHELIRRGRRMRCSIVAETGEAREMHHIACLLGYGAQAVNPYLAFAALRHIVEDAHTPIPDLTLEKALANYKKTLEKQVLKIMSKMGISAVASYCGAQIFEAIGIGDEVLEFCFAGTESRVGGVGFREIAAEVLERHQRAFREEAKLLDDYGYYRFRKGGEPHGYNPFMVRALHKFTMEGVPNAYQEFVREVRSLPPLALRDLLTFRPLGSPVPLEEVEPASEIVKRFTTASMSLGALSPEAHEVLAIATNRIGARANTGEGGEEQRRFRERRNGDNPNCAIKQVASGRFGVTPEYLAMADELEIKMAQGSKPGEGGQLPGHKVVAHIAAIRYTQVGVPLISPPPHHDIYSIEDLAQLIYDLKVANPRAKVAVKLVAEAGVGTIAAGVAKAYADIVHISGHEGGTGASPLSSIKNAGSPWELGVAETQQVLVLNDLRGRVRLRTDGMMRTAKDVITAAMLGAEEYAFGTAALIAIGCQMARQCHLNTCPVGIASQDPKLRAKFKGQPEHLIRYFFAVAEEVRQVLAHLGARKLEDIIGRADLLHPVQLEGHPKAHTLNLAPLTALPDPTLTRPRYCVQERNDRPEPIFDDSLLPALTAALEGRESVRLELPIRNIHRTVGGRIAGEIAYRYGNKGLPDGVRIELVFRGSAGQSFGAWCINGLRLVLYGQANDYVGKGMHGGEIILRPPEGAPYLPHENVICGNTVLYGATGGYLFAAGRAGERFAVRNSGAWAVVEGTGDHCCEYMTGGVVVVLGPTGRNFGAGMSGGIAFVLDEAGTLEHNLNPEMVQMETVADPQDVDLLLFLVQRHVAETGSLKGKQVLAEWNAFLPRFRKVSAKPTVAPPPPRELLRQRRDALLAAARTAGR
ncbi:MAG: glutamate synthase large subunit [Dehalococcoidia bacterium]|nr:glutamate synthase large subunit [Dehalococcoidia bacterium]MDW8119687.1 glutamate synthase large subunit [Chloroflexota bacterium]